jgi:hypothetical protein
MDLHSEAAKRLQPCAELRALASAVGGRLFRLNGYKESFLIVFLKEGVDFFG